MARQPKINSDINGYKYFRTRLKVGTDLKGKSIMKNFYGTSKTDAENQKKAYVKALESGINPELGELSLERSMNTWLWDIERNSGIKSSTFEKYESMFRNYVKGKELGRISVSEIKKIAVQKYYSDLIDSGKSHNVISNLNKLLSKFFNYAESESYILKNPLKGLNLPKNNEDDIEEEDKIIETFTQDESKQIISSLKHVKLRYIVMFVLLTGARLGEILSLEKSDIQDNIVKINKSVRIVKVFDPEDREKYTYERKITRPKTKHSKREVPMPEILIKEMKKLDKLVKEERLKLGPAYTQNNLLFPSLTGEYMDPKNLRRSWERALTKAKVPYKKFHSLRHTYATRLFENGTSILTVSRLLGHSSIKTTEIYTHVLEGIKAKEIECLNDIFK